MEIKLSDHFTYRRLFRFVIPSIIMMIFTSIYGVVDGFFVSNFAGKTEFTAVNLIMPFPMLLAAFGFMNPTGGSALVSMTLGQGKKKEANEMFSMIVKVTVIVGVIISILGILFIEEIALLLGATENLLEPCVTYGRLLLITLTPFMLQNLFQSFLVTAEKPTLGLAVTVIAGVTNMVLDYVLIGVLRWGITGAALATGISQVIGGVIPLIFFLKKNSSELRIVPSKMDFRALGKACFNGSSEMMTNISLSFISILYNLQLLKYVGENGVAAYGVIMYVNFIFISVFLGYAIGTAPIVGYNFGAKNQPEMKNVYKKSMVFNIVAGITMCIIAVALSGVLSGIFVGYDQELFAMTKRAFAIYSLGFIVTGVNIYGSAFFTAVGDGVLSAILSFLRILFFQAIAVLALPLFFENDGVWMANVTAEVIALIITVWLLAKNKKTYGY